MLKKKWLPSYKCCSCHWILKPFTSHWSSLTPVRTKNTLQIPNDFFYMLWLSGHYLERNKTFRNKNFKFYRSFLIYLQCNYYALHILKNKEKFNRWISVYSGYIYWVQVHRSLPKALSNEEHDNANKQHWMRKYLINLTKHYRDGHVG